MKLWMLGSGSSGNAVLVECEGARILIDAGFGVRMLAARLRSIGVCPSSIDACFVTHEHQDHVKGAGRAAKKWGWRIYATAGTASARALRETPVKKFKPGATIDLQRMTVETAPTPHDARESVGFVVTSRATGERAALFYDIGHVSRAVDRACRDVDILVLESNHDEGMLRAGPYPPWLQARIASDVGHLSNRHAGLFAKEGVTRTLSHMVLAHLSEKNNLPTVALRAMRAALKKTAFKGMLTAAKQDVVVGPFMPGRRIESPMQFSLF
jgi:phosphoribosyl 1,2-cyclic phosphodiesterase